MRSRFFIAQEDDGSIETYRFDWDTYISKRTVIASNPPSFWKQLIGQDINQNCVATVEVSIEEYTQLVTTSGESFSVDIFHNIFKKHYPFKIKVEFQSNNCDLKSNQNKYYKKLMNQIYRKLDLIIKSRSVTIERALNEFPNVTVVDSYNCNEMISEDNISSKL